MSKPQLILVHGMGDYASGWEAEIKTKLEECASRYNNLRQINIWDKIDVIPVLYNDVFVDAVNQWKAAAGPVSAFAAANAMPGSGSLAWLDDIEAEGGDFFWTAVADVIIYRFFKLFRDRVRASVAEQIIDPLLAASPPDFDRAVIVAHSLGTSVTHDTLHLLGTTAFAKYANAFSAPTERFRAIFMLANVSRVLQTDIKAYDSIVRPGPRNSTTTDCGRFYNFRQDVDPFLVVKRFSPVDFNGQLFTREVLTHYRHWNIHGFTHYLDHPRVHVRLFNKLLGDVVPPMEFIAAINNYPQFGGTFKDVPALQAEIVKLTALVASLGEDSSIESLMRVVVKARGILSQIKTIIDNLP